MYVQPNDTVSRWPAAEYLRVLWRAYERLEFDRAPLRAAIASSRAGARKRVFVYGTLLRGEANHAILVHSRFVRGARTMPSFALHDLGAYPALVTGGNASVAGEVYEVGPYTLRVLDRIEGHPRYYQRSLIELDDGSSAEAYLMSGRRVREHPTIVSGSWRARKEQVGG